MVSPPTDAPSANPVDEPRHAPPPTERIHLLGATTAELRDWTAAIGLEPYRTAQLAQWIFEKNAVSFDEMSNLSKAARQRCSQSAEIYRGRITTQSASTDGTTKLLVSWPDNASVEAVWIPEDDRHTACISSQVGCPVGCRFCASGLNGVERNLTAGEIVEQAMWIRRLVAGASALPAMYSLADVTRAVQSAPGNQNHCPIENGECATAVPAVPSHTPAAHRLSNIVLMGMGEPLANYDAVVKAIRIINAPTGMGIGARKITLSTVGLPAQIRKLADEGLQINLALSLHAPDDELRHNLIPWGKGVQIKSLVEACNYYFQQTGREVTLEYVLLEGVNNLPRHAEQLASIARQLRCNINLLRYNPVAGTPFARPSAEASFDFQRILKNRGANAHIRKSRGTDVNAACGQLRRSTQLTVATR